MKIIRFQTDTETGHAALQDDRRALVIEGDIFSDFRVSNRVVENFQLLAPVQPRTIMCIGLNYRQHALETGAPIPKYPVLFFKAPTALQHPNQPILLPTHLKSDQVDYEGELAIIIGKRCKNATRDNALDFVLGYSCANDISARDWQKARGGSQWSRGKTFDTFCPLGPVLVTRDEITDPNSLALQTFLNGEMVQSSNTSDMIFDVPTLIEFLSGSTTLEAGTVILTGTPSGVGMARTPPLWLKAGDEVTVEIERIGRLTNPVRDE